MAKRKRFGLWTLLDGPRVGKKVKCVCDCGTERFVVAADLLSGKSKGCGCTRFVNMHKARLEAITTHGLSNTAPEYRVWVDMRRRCHQPQRPDYRNYGARGIVVCDRWRKDFAAFYADIGPRPPNHTLERRNNDGPYSPANCYWATNKEQHQNTRHSRLIVVRGKRMSVAAAADAAGLNRVTVSGRLNRGWTPERALSEPPIEPRLRRAYSRIGRPPK